MDLKLASAPGAPCASSDSVTSSWWLQCLPSFHALLILCYLGWVARSSDRGVEDLVILAIDDFCPGGELQGRFSVTLLASDQIFSLSY